MAKEQVVLSTTNLLKSYGDFVALDTLNLSVKANQCVGYLGPNGSGKSTTIKILTGLVRPTSGSAHIFGYQIGINTRKALLNVGAVVETPVFPPFLTPLEVLSYYGRLRGMSQQHISERSRQVLETVKLGHEWSNRKLGAFSKGMTQRVAIACSLVHDPDLLILDEPTSGLDPRGRVEVREIIIQLKKAGKTILMSTHLLAEAAEVCDVVTLLDKGKLIKTDNVQNIIRSSSEDKVSVELLNVPNDSEISSIRALTGVVNVTRQDPNPEIIIEYEGGLERRADLFNKLGTLGLKIVAFRPAENTLESFYLNVVSSESTD